MIPKKGQKWINLRSGEEVIISSCRKANDLSNYYHVTFTEEVDPNNPWGTVAWGTRNMTLAYFKKEFRPCKHLEIQEDLKDLLK